MSLFILNFIIVRKKNGSHINLQKSPINFPQFFFMSHSSLRDLSMKVIKKWLQTAIKSVVVLHNKVTTFITTWLLSRLANSWRFTLSMFRWTVHVWSVWLFFAPFFDKYLSRSSHNIRMSNFDVKKGNEDLHNIQWTSFHRNLVFFLLLNLILYIRQYNAVWLKIWLI